MATSKLKFSNVKRKPRLSYSLVLEVDELNLEDAALLSKHMDGLTTALRDSINGILLNEKVPKIPFPKKLHKKTIYFVRGRSKK